MVPSVAIFKVRDCMHYYDYIIRGLDPYYISVESDGELRYDEYGGAQNYPSYTYIGKIDIETLEEFRSALKHRDCFFVEIGKVNGKFDISKFSFTILLVEDINVCDKDLYEYIYNDFCSKPHAVRYITDGSTYEKYSRDCQCIEEYVGTKTPETYDEMIDCPSIAMRVAAEVKSHEVQKLFDGECLDFCSIDSGNDAFDVYAIMSIAQYRRYVKTKRPGRSINLLPGLVRKVIVPLGNFEGQLYCYKISFDDPLNTSNDSWKLLTYSLEREDMRENVGDHPQLNRTNRYRPRYGVVSRFFGFLD